MNSDTTTLHKNIKLKTKNKKLGTKKGALKRKANYIKDYKKIIEASQI